METKANEKIFIGGGKSEVLLDEATNSISVAGVNVVTSQPGVGDILCRDESGGYRFIRLDTFHAGTFPSAWETLGVVAWRRGNQVRVVSKRSKYVKFMEVFPYVVGGFTLDGSEHVARLRLHGRPSTETFYEFRYTAGTVDEFVTALQHLLTTNGETDWSAYKDEQERVILQYDNYTSLERVDASLTHADGLELKTKLSVDMPAFPRTVRKCGNMGKAPVWNASKAKEVYIKDNSETRYNPESDVSSVPAYPVCWPAFAGTSQHQEDHCLWLRQRYCADPAHPKVEEWEEYIDDLVPKSPWMTGAFAPRYRDGAVFSAALKDVTYQAKDGSRKPLYPAVNTASELLDGGYIPTQYEFYEMFRNVTYGLSDITFTTADTINRSLHAIGGNEINVRNSFFLLGRIMTFQVFNASSTGEFRLYGSPYLSSYLTLAVKSLDLSRLNE